MSDFTHVSKFGKDHWSLLGYVECRCVDNDGCFDRRHMRSNPAKRTSPPPLMDSYKWRPQHGTRLAGFYNLETDCDAYPTSEEAIAAGVLLPEHDDFDCLDDLEANGYIEIVSFANLMVRLTEKGRLVANALRGFKSKGGTFAAFECPVEVIHDEIQSH